MQNWSFAVRLPRSLDKTLYNPSCLAPSSPPVTGLALKFDSLGGASIFFRVQFIKNLRLWERLRALSQTLVGKLALIGRLAFS